MTEKLWKLTERKICAVLGGTRVPVSGRQRGHSPDGHVRWLAIEIKHRKTMPGWMVDAMAQARASVRGNQLPAVVIHEQGKRHTGDFVVLRLADFADWFGDITADLEAAPSGPLSMEGTS